MRRRGALRSAALWVAWLCASCAHGDQVSSVDASALRAEMEQGDTASALKLAEALATGQIPGGSLREAAVLLTHHGRTPQHRALLGEVLWALGRHRDAFGLWVSLAAEAQGPGWVRDLAATRAAGLIDRVPLLETDAERVSAALNGGDGRTPSSVLRLARALGERVDRRDLIGVAAALSPPATHGRMASAPFSPLASLALTAPTFAAAQDIPTDLPGPQVLFVDLGGNYSDSGQAAHGEIRRLDAEAIYVNLRTSGASEASAALLANPTITQVWVYDLSTSSDAHAADYQAIKTWFEVESGGEVIADGVEEAVLRAGLHGGLACEACQRDDVERVVLAQPRDRPVPDGAAAGEAGHEEHQPKRSGQPDNPAARRHAVGYSPPELRQARRSTCVK